MIKKLNSTNLLLISCIIMVMNACNPSPEAIPFPGKLSEFAQPVTQKLSFSDPIRLDWQIAKSDSLVKFTDEKFDLRKIPSKPFNLNGYVPLSMPLKEIEFNLDDIPSTPFNLDTISTQKLKFKTALLGQPKRTKAGIPRLKDGASDNILLFGLDQGLAGSIVGSFMQDKDGIMWMTTDGGICRYDGEFCDVYSNQQGLSDPSTDKLLIDRQEQVWVYYMFSNKGISILNTKKGTVKSITQKEGLANNKINGLIEDVTGRIWVATDNGLNIIDQNNRTISNITTKQGLSGNRISSVFIDSKGNIWIGFGDNQGIDLINLETATIKHITPEIGIGNSGIFNFSEDGLGRIWIGTERNGAIIIDTKSGRLKYLNSENGLAGNVIRIITPHKGGKILIGFWGAGVDIFDENTATIKHISTQQGLSNDFVFSIYIDNTRQTWIGTNGGEVNLYNVENYGFQHPGSKQGLSNKSSFIYSFTQDEQSKIWVGSTGFGIDIIDEKNNTIKNISTGNFLQGDTVNYLFTDSKGRIWINLKIDMIDEKAGIIRHYNGFSGGIIEDSKGQIIFNRWSNIYFLNENTGLFKFIRKKEGYNINNIQCLMSDNKGKIWIGSGKGIDIIDENAGLLKHVDTEVLGNSFIHNLLMDNEGKIWAATAGNGLWMINEKNETATNFTITNGLPDMAVYTVNERSGSIFAGTGKGIAQLTLGTNEGEHNAVWNVKSYGKQQGMLRVDHNPRSFLSKDGHLWFGIADVLTIMDEPKIDTLVPHTFINSISVNGKVQNFVSAKQFQSELTEGDTIWTTQWDTFYTKNNLINEQLQNNKIKYDSVIGPYNMPVNLSSPFNENYLTFNFTGTHLNNTDKTRYSYVLEGNDKAWSDITNKSYAEYRNLSPGKYTFKVRSMGFNNRWSEPAVLSFTIRPPWWQTLWAYCLYALITSGLFRAYIRYHSRALRKENLVLEEKVQNRTRKLQESIETLKSTQGQLIQSEKMASLGQLTAGIAHEIQNPLNFVNNFSEVSRELIVEMNDELAVGNLQLAKEIAGDIEQNLEKINHHGKRADAIVKGMLQHSRTSTGQKELTDINALADEYLRLSYHGMRAKDKSFNAEFKTDFDPTLAKINVVPQDIGRVILNLINNAFYAVDEKKKQQSDGYEPSVFVSTKKNTDKIEISVKDNGPGIPLEIKDKIFQPFFTTKPTGQGTGLGLSLAYDIVKAHGGEIKVESKPARAGSEEENEGTTFSIELPIN